MCNDVLKDKKEIIDLIESQKASYDIDEIKRALDFCVEAHKGQKRFTNEDYYIHPFSVAKILIEMGMDTQSVVASLLHDVVEDTEYTLEDVEKMFGSDVALLVDGVTKINRLSFTTKEQQQAENLRKMLIAMGKDIRVIIIKLADRLHNMRTLDAMTEKKQLEKSVETLELYAPIAHRLGIRHVKEELEDLAIKHLDPVGYNEIETMLIKRKQQREQILEDIKSKIEETLRKEMPGVNLAFQGRVKSVHGIYRKMYYLGKDFDEIYDVYAIRVITDTVADCYNILGIMHDRFQPIPNRFKDYIATPKPNMYQSLHTTVISRDGLTFEIQIRTFEMHKTAELGIAAHWKYKEGVTKNDNFDDRLAWIRQILESEDGLEDSSELLRSIKVDLSQEDVFAVTPKGDVISLPVGSTIVDFAFAIHSAVGIKMIGAKVDGKIVQINHRIQTGEVIEIITANQSGKGPSRDWINIAVTNSAKAKIRSWFKKEKRPENIMEGKESFERELKHAGVVLTEEERKQLLDDLTKKNHFTLTDDFFAAIGYGGILLSKIIPKIRDDYFKKHRNSTVSKIPENIPEKQHSTDGVIVDGIDNCLVKLSRCCAPLPGDEIIGFITRGHGVSIHKRDCTNVPADISACEEPERWITAHWNSGKSGSFISVLQIDSIDRDGLLVDVMTTMNNIHVPLNSINATKNHGNCTITISINCESVEHLKNIISKLLKTDGVFSVERIIR